MLDYLSDYRTQDTLRGVHYYPKGALCWFTCNRLGVPTGSVYIARRVPDLKLIEIPRRQRGLKKLQKERQKKYTLVERLCREKVDTEQWPVKKLCFDK